MQLNNLIIRIMNYFSCFPKYFSKQIKLLIYSTVVCLISVYYPSDLYSQKDTGTARMSFDFGLSRGNNINLLPFFKRTKTKQSKELDILFPLYGYKKDFIKQSKRSHLFPVYWNENSPVIHDLRIVSFYYPSIIHVSREKVKNMCSFKVLDLAPEINFLEYTKSADGQYLQNNFFFLLWYSNNIIQQKSHFVVFPLYWSFKNKDNFTRTFVPFYLGATFRNKPGNYFAITPFYWHFKEPDKTRNILLPVWWNMRSVKGNNSINKNVIFPVYWSYKDQNKIRNVFFPLLWNYKNNHFHSFCIFPVFLIKEPANKSWSKIMVTPLYWQNKSNDYQRNILFPVWWYKVSGKGTNRNSSNILFPIYWSYKSVEKSHQILFPVIWNFKNDLYSSFTIFPIFSKGCFVDGTSSHLVVTPLFWHFKNDNEIQNILFPVYWGKKEYSNKQVISSRQILPLYWHSRDETMERRIVFPLVWMKKNPEYTINTVIPLFSYGYSPDKVKKHLIVTPLLWTFKNDNSNRAVLFPLFYSFKNDIKYRKIFFPLICYIKDTLYSSISVAPLFSSGHSADNKNGYVMATPLYWHFKTDDGYKNRLYPIWWNSKKGSGDGLIKKNVIFPVYWSSYSKEKNNKIVFPVLWDLKNEFYTSFTVFPFISSGHNIDLTSKHLVFTPLFWHFEKPQSIKNIVFPIYWSSVTNIGEETEEKNILFPIYWSYKSPDKNNKILFPVLFSLKNDQYKSLTVFPVFSTGISANSDTKHLAVTPLFWHFESPERKSSILFPVLWSSNTDMGGYRIKQNVVFPVFWSYKAKDSNNTVLFPIVWNFKSQKQHTFVFFPLFTAGRTADNSRNHMVITPLFWHIKNYEYYKNFLIPIWFNFKNTSETDPKNNHIAFGIFWSLKNKHHNNKILFPVIWKMSNYRYNSFTFFPVFSTGRSADNVNRHLVLTPFIWDIHRKDSKRFEFVPLLSFYSEKPGRRDFRILYFLFYTRKDIDLKVTGFLVPLCIRVKRPDYSYFRFAPVVWYKNTPKDKYFSVQPIFYQSSDSVSKNFYLFWQLYTSKNIYNVRKSNNFLWKVVYNDKYSNGDHEFRILYMLFSDMKKDGKEEHGLFPFYLITKDDAGYKSLSVAFYFYRTFQRKIEGSNEYYREDDIFWFIRLRSNYRQLKAKGINEKLIR